MMKSYTCALFSLSLLAIVSSPLYQSDSARIRRLIISTRPLNVANASTDANGDIIVPTHSVGFSGTGSNRVEIFEESRHLAKVLEKYVAFNPNSDVLFPCSLIQGRSLPDGTLDPIAVRRTPATITVTDFISSAPNASYSRRVLQPTLATTTEAVRRILNQRLQRDQPSKFSYSEVSVNSIESALLKLGASYSWVNGHVTGSFSTNTASHRTNLMVRFVQSYYTVNCETPSSPTSFLFPGTRFRDFELYASDGNPPAYISSVTYGRELWMYLQSRREESEVKAALNAALNAALASGSIDLSTAQRTILNESSVQLLALGGNAPAAIEIAAGDHFAELRNYLRSGANYSRTSPAVIISYTARYLRDSSIARVSSVSDYTIRTNRAAPAPLANVTITWRTTGDNKDWDTQPVADVYDKVGRRIGHIECCSADRSGDSWSNGNVSTRTAQILVGGLTPDDFTHGRLSTGRRPHGNDDWDYTATVTLIFSDGTRETHTCGARNGCEVAW